MTTLRTISCALTALLFATFALPSIADEHHREDKKLYSLDMAIVSAPPAQTSPPFTVSATIKSKGDDDSTIKSFTLSVTGLTIVAVDPPNRGTVAGPFPGSSVSVTHIHHGEEDSFAHPAESDEEDSFTLTLHVSSCGDGAWSAVAWTGETLNGHTFTLVPGDSTVTTSIPCGNLASGASFTVPDSLNPNCVTGKRGYYDKNGSIPAGALPYFVTNLVSQAHFRWPDFSTGGDPFATFEYAVCGPGPLPAITDVAWLNLDGSPASTPGTPAYLVAQDCLEPDQLPTPYGTLTTNVGLTDSTIAVDTTTPAGGPPAGSIPYPGSGPTSPQNPGTAFDIVLGTERITVQLVCRDNDGDPTDTSDCTEEGEGKALTVVQRGVGGTTTTTHPAGSLVMSTPLPLLPEGVPAPYTAGKPALMCIASQQGEGESGSHATTFIDIGGDGWVNHP
jgi:hypothetical protein